MQELWVHVSSLNAIKACAQDKALRFSHTINHSCIYIVDLAL